MYRFFLHFSNRKSLWLLMAMGLLLPLLLALFCPLLFFSADDVMVVYTLSGQMGLPPMPWTDYHWGWHYLLGKGFASLYTHFPSQPWYGYFLVALMGMNGCLFLAWLQHIFPPRQTFAYGFLLYAGFLIPFWAHLNFSGVSFCLGLMAGLWWLPLPGDGSSPFRWWPLLLLIIGFALRWHTTALGLGMASFGLLAFHPGRWKGYLFGAGLGLVIGFGLIQQHRYWCRQHIPGWEKDIEVRKALYAFYNLPTRPVVEAKRLLPTLSLQQQYQNSFLLDSSRFSTAQLHQIADSLHSRRWFWEQRAQKQLNTLFTTHQWIIWVMVYLALMLLVDSNRKGRGMSAVLAGGALLLVFALFTFFKLTHVLLTGIGFAGACGLMLAKSRYPFRQRRLQGMAAFAIGCVLMIYFAIRFRQTNRAWEQQFYCAVKSLPKDKTVIATGQQFPFAGMPVFASPRYYPLANLFSPGQAGLAVRNKYLNQKPLKDWVEDSSVLLTGNLLDLPGYFAGEGIRKKRVSVTDSSSCLPLWKLNGSDKAGE